MVLEIGVGFVGAGPVGAPIELHLEHPEVQSDLNSGFVVFAFDEPNGDLSWDKGPFFEEFGDISLHT